MKNISIIFLVLSASIYAQDSYLPVNKGDVPTKMYNKLKEKISVNYKNLTLIEFAKLFEEEYKIEVGLSDNRKIDKEKYITLKTNNMAMEHVLGFVEKLSGSRIKIIDNKILIE